LTSDDDDESSLSNNENDNGENDFLVWKVNASDAFGSMLMQMQAFSLPNMMNPNNTQSLSSSLSSDSLSLSASLSSVYKDENNERLAENFLLQDDDNDDDNDDQGTKQKEEMTTMQQQQPTTTTTLNNKNTVPLVTPQKDAGGKTTRDKKGNVLSWSSLTSMDWETAKEFLSQENDNNNNNDQTATAKQPQEINTTQQQEQQEQPTTTTTTTTTTPSNKNTVRVVTPKKMAVARPRRHATKRAIRTVCRPNKRIVAKFQ
jgi:hypothetical protein